MDADRFQTADTDRIRVLITNPIDPSVGVTGLTVALSIQRTSDSYWWNGSAFQSGYTTVSMTQTDATNRAGEYHYNFAPATAITVVYRATSGTYPIQTGGAIFGGFVQNLNAPLDVIDSNVDILVARDPETFITEINTIVNNAAGSEGSFQEALENVGMKNLSEEVRRLALQQELLTRRIDTLKYLTGRNA